jgi:prolyl-tRNA synthetase
MTDLESAFGLLAHEEEDTSVMYALMSRHFPSTRREAKSGLMGSHSLLERAGYIRNAGAAGIFILLPLGWRVHQQICRLIFDTMEKGGVHNLQLPILQPQALWEQTGRWSRYQSTKTMFTTTEQHSQIRFGLAPTSEEVMTALAAMEIRSWRDLPLVLHQIGPKFRDELRPAMGLLRCREFSMSDAYSFDRDETGMRTSFEQLRKIYSALFGAAGLHDFILVQADSGTMGGHGSAAFLALSENGDDALFACDHCDYRAAADTAQGLYLPPESGEPEQRAFARTSTPNTRTVEELTAMFPELDATQMVKTIIFSVTAAGETFAVAACVRGDLEVNDIKVTNALGADAATAAESDVVEAITGAAVGFAGPIGLQNVRSILFDKSVQRLTNFLCGLNETDYHALNVNWERDLPRPATFVDIASAAEGHTCAVCGQGALKARRGIEVGHIFMLDTQYAEKLSASFVDQAGSEQTIWMGCYGIGTTRLMQAIVEQNHDEQGIIWPQRVAPYDAYVIAVNMDEVSQVNLARHACSSLSAAGWSVVFDDRPLRAGPKFMDADLLGIPWRITSGRRAASGIVELRERRTGDATEIAVEHLSRVLREKSASMPRS